jgi:hypothetical protein
MWEVPNINGEMLKPGIAISNPMQIIGKIVKVQVANSLHSYYFQKAA